MKQVDNLSKYMLSNRLPSWPMPCRPCSSLCRPGVRNSMSKFHMLQMVLRRVPVFSKEFDATSGQLMSHWLRSHPTRPFNKFNS